MQRKSHEEAKQWLKENGFIYLGGVNSMDCWTEIYVRRVGDAYEVAKVDGWHGDYRPWIYTTKATPKELCSKLDDVALYKCHFCQSTFNASELVGDFDFYGRWWWQCPHCRSSGSWIEQIWG